MSVAFAAWGVVIYFNLRASRWLRTWPLLAEIALRALVMAITIAAVIAGLEVDLRSTADEQMAVR